MAWFDRYTTSLFGRRMGLQHMTTNVSGASAAPGIDLIVGAEDIRKGVTTETTAAYLKAYGVSLVTSVSSSAVFRMDPPIPGVEKTIVFGSTGGASMYVTCSTGGSETISSTLGTSFTVMKSTVGNGGVVRLIGLTTSQWGLIGTGSTVIAAQTTTT